MCMTKGPQARASRRPAQPGGGALKCGASFPRWGRALARARRAPLLGPTPGRSDGLQRRPRSGSG